MELAHVGIEGSQYGILVVGVEKPDSIMGIKVWVNFKSWESMCYLFQCWSLRALINDSFI